MKYHVHYTDDCSPFLKSFKTAKDRDKWLLAWFLENQVDMGDGGYWVDLVFEGEITFQDEGINNA